MFQQSVTKTPLHWGSWLELAQLVTDKDMVTNNINNNNNNNNNNSNNNNN